MTINDLRAAAHAATEREQKASDAYQVAKTARAQAFADYNTEAARAAGIEIGKTVIKAARYSWDWDKGKLTACVAVQPSAHSLDALVVRDVTAKGEPWRGRRSYTVSIDMARVTDRVVSFE